MDLFERGALKIPAGAKEEVLEGTIERVVFSGGGGEFTVARLKADRVDEPVTVVGGLAGLPAGATLRVRGFYETNPRFGKQFRVLQFTELSPRTREGIAKYLGAGLIKGIGPEFAKRIVERFGDETLAILDAKPHRIREVPGIGRTRALAIQNAWASQRGQREVMVFLQGYGVSPSLAARIYKRYGDKAVASVRENPYRLAFDVWGIGFLSADRLASALGIGKDAEVRLSAGLRHELTEAAGKGHVFLPRADLIQAAAQRLSVDEAKLQPALEALALEGTIAIEHTGEGEAIYEASLLRAERAVATGMKRLLSAEHVRLGIDPAVAIARYEAETKLTLAPMQAKAIEQALVHPVLVLTGGPGVGKTTIVRGIVSAFVRAGKRVALAAPTGRAAKRLSESTGQAASTLHRLLEWRPAENRFGKNRDEPLDADLLVVDESSMIDIRLCADMLAALSVRTRLLMVGDQDQLPSVGPGTVLRDVIRSNAVPVVRLNEIFRQAAQSLIVRNAHLIHDGEMPDLGAAPAGGPAADTRDFFFLEEEDPAAAALLVRDLVVARLPRRYGFSPREIQVLTPMHRGELGAANLNQLLQEALLPGGEPLRPGERAFRVGDRVMQLRNNYDRNVYNGDVGTITSADREEQTLKVRFDDREVDYDFSDLDELTLAYAATVHKSQGSEYPAVIVPLHTQHFMLLQRGLVYTAVTRGKKLVILLGTRKALSLALKNADVQSRHSRLSERLSS